MVSVWLYVPVQCAGALLQSCTARRLLLEDARAPVCFTRAEWNRVISFSFTRSGIPWQCNSIVFGTSHQVRSWHLWSCHVLPWYPGPMCLLCALPSFLLFRSFMVYNHQISAEEPLWSMLKLSSNGFSIVVQGSLPPALKRCEAKSFWGTIKLDQVVACSLSALSFCICKKFELIKRRWWQARLSRKMSSVSSATWLHCYSKW